MTAMDRALMYLSIKPRTGKQVEKYLKDKGFETGEIREVISELKEYRYIDDAAFARLYFNYGFDKGRGESRIRRELMEKGVERDTIDDVVYELEDAGEMPDQFSIAMEIGQSVIGDTDLKSLEYNERKKLEARVARRLATRGFNNSIVFKVVKELENI